MKWERHHYIGLGIGALIIIIDFLAFLGQPVFAFIIGIGVLVAAVPFIITLSTKVTKEKEKEEMFLEFARNLVESVKAGNPISRSIINVRNKDYGSLTPHIQKLANQIAIGIPVSQALLTFSSDIKNNVVSRSISLIIEAEKSGGEIDLILESTAKSVAEVEEVKKERQSSMFSLVVEGYIIFFIFLIIMIAVQVKFIPAMMKTVSEAAPPGGLGLGFGLEGGQAISPETLGHLFLGMIIVQGFFAGLVIGKLSEGKISAGVKHSLIITAMAFLVTTGVQAFLV